MSACMIVLQYTYRIIMLIYDCHTDYYILFTILDYRRHVHVLDDCGDCESLRSESMPALKNFCANACDMSVEDRNIYTLRKRVS